MMSACERTCIQFAVDGPNSRQCILQVDEWALTWPANIACSGGAPLPLALHLAHLHLVGQHAALKKGAEALVGCTRQTGLVPLLS